MRLLIAAAAAATLLPAASAGAATRSVDSAGADAGDCVASPCRSAGYVLRQARAGDTIAFGAGRFASSHVSLPVDVPDLTVRGAGSGQTVVTTAGRTGFVLGEKADGFTLRGVRVATEEQTSSAVLVADRALVTGVRMQDVAAPGRSAISIPETATIVRWALDGIHVANSAYGILVRGLAFDLTISQSDFAQVGVGVGVQGPIKGVSNAQRVTVTSSTFTGGALAIFADGVDQALFSKLTISGATDGIRLSANGTRTRDVQVRASRIDVLGTALRAESANGGVFDGLHLTDVGFGASPAGLVQSGVSGVTLSGKVG